jgi:hypothetical protein
MRRRTWCVVAAVALVGLPTGATTTPAMPERICDRDPTAIARAIAAREVDVVGSVVTVLAVNDIRCEALEGRPGGADMANIAVAVDTGGERLYGIYHVHFTGRSDVTSAAPVLRLRPLAENRWREAWCRLINRAYPGQRAEQDCPEDRGSGRKGSGHVDGQVAPPP